MASSTLHAARQTPDTHGPLTPHARAHRGRRTRPRAARRPPRGRLAARGVGTCRVRVGVERRAWTVGRGSWSHRLSPSLGPASRSPAARSKPARSSLRLEAHGVVRRTRRPSGTRSSSRRRGTSASRPIVGAGVPRDRRRGRRRSPGTAGPSPAARPGQSLPLPGGVGRVGAITGSREATRWTRGGSGRDSGEARSLLLVARGEVGPHQGIAHPVAQLIPCRRARLDAAQVHRA